MNVHLERRVIVITGASSGFGRGAALRFAQAGARIVVAARRLNLLQELVELCPGGEAQAAAVRCDVNNESDVKYLLEAAVERFGHVDVWINNAGAAAVGPFLDVPLSDHRKVIETNLLGTIYGSYVALKHFKESGHGILINVASMIGRISAPYYASYSAAKHGVVGFSTSLRQELQEEKQTDIHVCTVLPMAMDTGFFENSANYSGHETVPIPPLDNAEKVIEVLVRLAMDPKNEVPVGKGSGLVSLSYRLAPTTTERVMAANVRHALETAPLAPAAGGELARPPRKGAGIKGKDQS